MASTILEDVKAFLDELVGGLTELYVGATRAAAASTDGEALSALQRGPGVLIEGAQQLSARVSDALDAEDGGEDAEPKAKAKPKAVAKR